KEVVGSGPFRFLKDEHISGAQAAFARFDQYRPRDSGALGFTSGPKVAHFERVEFLTLDPFSAQGALSRGEIDWWESPSRDLADQVARDRNVRWFRITCRRWGSCASTSFIPRSTSPRRA